MRLIIDATSATDRITGLERYTREITKELVKQAPISEYQLTILIASNSVWSPEYADPEVVFVRSPFSSRLLTEQVWIPSVLLRLRPAVAFFPAFPPSPLVFALSGVKVARTLHDAVIWRHPETISIKNRFYTAPLEKYGLRRYQTIYTDSEFSRSELEALFPSVAARVVNAGAGIDSRLSEIGNQGSEVTRKYGVTPGFVLFVGTLEPRKNLPFLLRAFHLMRQGNRPANLVVAGRLGWGSRAVLSAIDTLGLHDSVKILGPVSDEDLVSLYRLASVLVLPSLYEGFGLPIIEAMALGTPVIASNVASLSEVAGDAAVLLPPDDLNAWAEAIHKTMTDKSHAELLRIKGYERAAFYSWRTVAQKIMVSLPKVNNASI
jgi:glycosyltransferase involved in cell wall biosynthesis